MTPSPGAIEVPPAARPLTGQIRVPGDKSISHRALLLAARAEGHSELTGVSAGSDVAHTAAAVAAFGAGIESHQPGAFGIEGGLGRLHEPDHVVDVGNSGTGIRLLAGWAAGVPGLAVLQGDESIARRPMGRVVAPLRAMGAQVDGRQDGKLPPLVVRGGDLRAIDYRLPVASAQVQGAILLAALAGDGPTTVHHDAAIRTHTEEMLAACGAKVVREPGAVTVWPGPLTPFRLDVPADPSQAAFWVVAATLIPGSELTVSHVYVGPGRAAFVDALQRMGADITVDVTDEDQHTADLHVRAASLHATEVAGPEVPGLIDEVPILAVAAAHAEGTTVFADAAELRVKESDRVATTTAALRALGVSVEPQPDGLVVHGAGSALRPANPAVIDAAGDHRIAMASAVAALAGPAPVSITGWASVATSYPGFEEDLHRWT